MTGIQASLGREMIEECFLKWKVKVTQLCLTLCNPMTIQSTGFSRPEY